MIGTILGCVLFVVGTLMLLRSSAVFRVRSKFIWDSTFPVLYDALPSYDAMVFNPRHWLRWTRAQWLRWLQQKAYQE